MADSDRVKAAAGAWERAWRAVARAHRRFEDKRRTFLEADKNLKRVKRGRARRLANTVAAELLARLRRGRG